MSKIQECVIFLEVEHFPKSIFPRDRRSQLERYIFQPTQNVRKARKLSWGKRNEKPAADVHSSRSSSSGRSPVPMCVAARSMDESVCGDRTWLFPSDRAKAIGCSVLLFPTFVRSFVRSFVYFRTIVKSCCLFVKFSCNTPRLARGARVFHLSVCKSTEQRPKITVCLRLNLKFSYLATVTWLRLCLVTPPTHTLGTIHIFSNMSNLQAFSLIQFEIKTQRKSQRRWMADAEENPNYHKMGKAERKTSARCVIYAFCRDRFFGAAMEVVRTLLEQQKSKQPQQ